MPDRVEPFVIGVDEAALEDLRDRLRRARWPEREPVGDWSQGVPLGYLRELCAYWAGGYDWRATEARLNQIPQFTTAIDGLDIHFVHVRSPHPGAVPLVMTHGWPGSFLEFEQVLGPLADPAAHGADAAAGVFDVVVPSLPGYGFSGKPATPGWDIHRIARAWAELMTRLGYERFLAMGSDWGTSVSTSLALQHPGRLLGVHLVPPLAPPDRTVGLTGDERAALADLDQRSRTGSGYSAVQGTRPQTIGYSLTDSPTGLCAWIVEKLWAWTDHPGDLSQVLTADQVLDNITLYWLTATGASAAACTGKASPRSPTGSPPRRAIPSPSPPRAASSPKRYRGPLAVRPSAASPTSSTGTSPPAGATSPPGNSPACSPAKSAPPRTASSRKNNLAAVFQPRIGICYLICVWPVHGYQVRPG
jgi:pimeloyl-ACP methyl ester carboxylesterase